MIPRRLAGPWAWWLFTAWWPIRRSPAGRLVLDPLRLAYWRWQQRRDPDAFAARVEARATRRLDGLQRLQQLTAEAPHTDLCRNCSDPRNNTN
ncbi:hypothetical protein [Kitasatospora sp. NPDC001527]|uniref:hypothetical protein n=1 Tax=Kitasatospora sp. NPDC001527 TaxID=3154519 RepID=UPI00333414F0